jgi:hypothetical protein
MTVSRFVLVDFRYTSDPLGHIRLYEAGNTYDMPPTLAHAAAKRDLVAANLAKRHWARLPPAISDFSGGNTFITCLSVNGRTSWR